MKKNMNKRVSSFDVANYAGVSQSTVSRVFSNKKHLISSKTIDRVMAAADELGYCPSMIASSLSKKSTRIIGIEMNDFSNAYYTEALGLFSNAFEKKGYQIMIFNGGMATNLEDKLRSALEYQVAGLILTNVLLSDDYIAWAEKYQTPIFLFNRLIREEELLNTVVGDNYLGGYKVGTLLRENKMTKLAYFGGDQDSYTNFERHRGFVDSLKDSNINVYELDGVFSYESGYDRGKILMAHGADVDGVFCASDSIALGLIDYIKHETSLKIPNDISIVGFDGIEEGNNINYRLTTYKQPIESIVEETVDAMVKKIESEVTDQVHIMLEGELVIRDTVKIIQ